MQRMNRNIIRIASTPYRRHVHNPVAEDASDLDQEQRIVATLSKNPRTLQALWQEYEIGGPGRKPVKDWTAHERGTHKHSIYLRKFFWNKVSAMVRAGVEANDACERIYAAYGHNQSVTKILNALKRDSATGGHPNLHIRHI